MKKWYTDTKGPYTHLSMDGGPSLNVSKDDLTEFYQEYTSQVQKGEKFYFVERRTKLFHFFMDVDFISDQKLDRLQIIDLCKRIHSVIQSKSCFICVSKSVKRGDKIKSGIHLHFPDLIVTSRKALELRNLLPDDLREYVDDSVYKGSGLRMLWSYKKGDGPPYTPFYDLIQEKYIDSSPSVEYLKLLSIQTDFDDIITDSPNKESIDPLETFIRMNFKNQQNLNVKNIKDDEKRLIIQTNSHYCENKQSEHKSNHVYFVVDKKSRTIFQKCFDDTCKNFESRRRRLSPSLKI